MTDLMTIREVRRAVRKAQSVFVEARFGVAERDIKITKSEAIGLLATFEDDTTPEQAEMYSGRFGVVVGGDVYLG